ncbi:hypothetical protein MGA3_08900 [Bacillus methanolicus MGA3]|nr:hypothetical protein MGA3_08900 [Bacillus methanolicus MGA3]
MKKIPQMECSFFIIIRKLGLNKEKIFKIKHPKG